MERKKLRLEGYDYSGVGYYFITICTQHRIPLFWAGERAGSKPAQTPIPEAIRQFKTFSARKINQMRGTPGTPIWQRSYYDHIIRDEPDYLRIWTYIDANPAKWKEDEYYVV